MRQLYRVNGPLHMRLGTSHRAAKTTGPEVVRWWPLPSRFWWKYWHFMTFYDMLWNCIWFLHFKTHAELITKNAIIGLPDGNRIRDPANLVWYSANWATKAVAEFLLINLGICSCIDLFVYKFVRLSEAEFLLGVGFLMGKFLSFCIAALINILGIKTCCEATEAYCIIGRCTNNDWMIFPRIL